MMSDNAAIATLLLQISGRLRREIDIAELEVLQNAANIQKENKNRVKNLRFCMRELNHFWGEIEIQANSLLKRDDNS
jgi:hypothetical protein